MFMPSNQLPGAFTSGKRRMSPNGFHFIMQEALIPQKMTARGCCSKYKNLIRESRHDILNGASNDHEGSGKNGWKQNSRVGIGATLWPVGPTGRKRRRREGSSRESKKDYLHFLYISRGSLSETQYFVHLSRRLGYLSDAEAERLIGQTRQTFACLHGLIRAVEKEAGKFNKMVATITSLLVLGVARWSSP